MAVEYVPSEDTVYIQKIPENNIIYIDFQSKLTRAEIMRRIGERAVIGWHAELHTEVLSSEPISISEDEDGSIDVKFKQYHRGYATNEYGTPNTRGWSGGAETLRILAVRWDAESHSLHSSYVRARNFRYQLLEIESRKRHPYVVQELQELRDALWNE
jgi:hypothetical protein